jgi:hypothetical protein
MIIYHDLEIIMLKPLYIPVMLLVVFLLSGLSLGQNGSSLLDEEEQIQVLKKIGTLLDQNYVFQDIGRQCADYLAQQIESGRYSSYTHPRALAEQLTADLRKIHRDLIKTRDRMKDNKGIVKVEVLTGNIGYIELYSFEPLELARDQVVAALRLIENTDAIIFDLRNNIGGNPAMVQFFCSPFFDQPTHLNSFFWRRGDYSEEFWTMENIDLKKRPKVPLFVLTSSKTFSGAEEFAYNLQTQNRATIIGEKTAGGANPGYSFRINNRYSIFIPTGRAVNPVTTTNWEGSGVTPDIAVKSNNAYSAALDKARHAARQYRENDDYAAVGQYLNLSVVLDSAEVLCTKNLADAAYTIVDSALQYALARDLLGEWTINELGYRYLGKKKMEMAFILLKFNADYFPQSFNVYDSLGEIYLKQGNPEKAAEYYNKSLVLNPQNYNARYMMQQIKKDMK